MIRAAIAGLLVLTGCGGGGATEPPPEYPPMEPTTTSTDTEATAEPAEPAEPPPPPITVVAAERTPVEGNAPTIRITRPRNGQTIRRGNVSLQVRLRNWELGEAPGNHVHIVVDNEPYIAVRDVRRPLNLNELVQEHLGHELAPGTHVVRVFPSRSHHESVKEGAPFAMVTFNYQEATEGFELDAEAPLLTFSRPKGCATAGERLLLDFYLTNVETLADDGYQVGWSVDGQTRGVISEWAPHYIENLPPGEHEIRLMLLNAGEPVAGPFNQTTRTITVAPSCEAPAPAADTEGEAAESTPAPAGG